MNFYFEHSTIKFAYFSSKTPIYIIGSVSSFYYFVLVHNFLMI